MAILSFKPGNTVSVIHTNGELPPIGDTAPEFSLVDKRLKTCSLLDYTGKIKLLNIVPSLDTPVCAASARAFNEKASRFDNTVMLMVSADLPFAQERFCLSEGLKNIRPLSCFRSSFAQDYGVKIIDGLFAGLTARAVVIIDVNDQVIYSELVTELTHEPDYDAALEAIGHYQ